MNKIDPYMTQTAQRNSAGLDQNSDRAMDSKERIGRRGFLKLAAAGAIGLVAPGQRAPAWADFVQESDFPKAERLGRAAKGTLELKARPDPDAPTIGQIYQDGVAPWLREVAGRNLTLSFRNQRWVETPNGYVYGAFFQPVRNSPNQPVDRLPSTSIGPGMWAEVTVPYADVTLQNDPSANSWVRDLVDQKLPVRVYYSQVFWVDQIKKNGAGKVYYRVNPNYYGGLDMLWVPGEALRPLTEDELAPIHPDVADKRIVVDVNAQTLSCYEGPNEVYFCRISSGAKFNMNGQVVEKWATPAGRHVVERKYISLQMSGGSTGAGYDLPGIGWSIIFATGGVAIHSTFWHNNYGDTMSHGCVNVSPEDCKWIFRWTQPHVGFDPGKVDVTTSGMKSTPVTVQEV
jgi:lipoprotein-anchoring transpeptidase ErfK/SrfK